MNLKEWYENLPEPNFPKKDALKEIAERCKVSEVTVRTWLLGKNIPCDSANRKILSEVTGLSEDELFKY